MYLKKSKLSAKLCGQFLRGQFDPQPRKLQHFSKRQIARLNNHQSIHVVRNQGVYL